MVIFTVPSQANYTLQVRTVYFFYKFSYYTLDSSVYYTLDGSVYFGHDATKCRMCEWQIARLRFLSRKVNCSIPNKEGKL